MEETIMYNPPEVPRTFHQLGILVLDGSGSMGAKGRQGLTKAQEVAMAVQELFNRFNVSNVKNNFSFAGIKFDNSPEVIVEPTKFTELDYMNIDWNPMNGKGGGTHIFDALEEAKRMAEEFLQGAPEGGVKHSVVILLMSDGLCFNPERTKSVADEIKANPDIVIASAYFAELGQIDPDASQIKNLLQQVATDPEKYYSTVYDGDALRKFFERSISQSSGIGRLDSEIQVPSGVTSGRNL